MDAVDKEAGALCHVPHRILLSRLQGRLVVHGLCSNMIQVRKKRRQVGAFALNWYR